MKRETIELNQDWKFIRGDQPYPGYKGVDDREWRTVTVPHDWSVEEEFSREFSSGTGYVAHGIGWYRKHFSLDEDHAGGKIHVTFEGVYNNSRVWCNSYYLGKRPNGYSTFTYDITDYVHFANVDNVISVQVDHQHSADSRWFTGSGIYRNVYLTATDTLHFREYGVFITTTQADARSARLNAKVEIDGLPEERAGLEVVIRLKDDRGKTVAEASAQPVQEAQSIDLSVESPKLWSPEHPHLYTASAQILAGGDVVDEISVKTGIRTFCFDPKTGFSLNETRMKLRGVCLHHDAGCLGAAVPNSVWRRRFSELRAMGCNAIRCSHNPPAPEFLDLCDEMGFLVMDEAFDEWEGVKNKWWQGHNVLPPKHFGYSEDFPEWHQRDLQGMVKRDRNHPSIICWSIGNEIDYPNDPYSHPIQTQLLEANDKGSFPAGRAYNQDLPNAERLAVIAKELVRLVKECDTSRPVTAALAFPEASTQTGFADALDIVGYNYKEYLYEDHAKRWPDRVIYGSENGKRLSDWEYVRDNENICAQFLWTGIDYLGEAHGWPVRAAAAGLLDTAGYRKASWYYRRSFWDSSPMVQLVSVAVEEKDVYDAECFHWNYQTGETVLVKAYSNCERVELFLNGRSLGEQNPAEATTLFAGWLIPFESGELEAIAVDSAGGRHVSRLKTADAPSSIQASIHEGPPDMTGYVEIDVSLADSEGRPVTFTDRVVTVAIDGEATLVGLENGNVQDISPYHRAERTTYRGRLKAYARKGEGTSVVRLSSDGLTSKELVL